MSIVEQLFLDTLRQSQWLPPAELTHYQRPLLEGVVRHAATQTSFYSERLRPLFGDGDPATATLDFSRWPEVPIVTRAQAVDVVDQMKARTVPPAVGATVADQSSGSTGRPLHHLRSALSDSANRCARDRVYEIHNVDLFGTMAVIPVDRQHEHPYPLGAKRKGWNRTALDTNCYYLDIGTSPANQLEWLERVRPDHVMTYPLNLREVAEAASARGGQTLRLKTFVALGEVLDEETREVIARTFDCHVIDIYAAREIGLVAFQCPDGNAYHLSPEIMLCELLDDDGRPVRPGEFGRVVVTTFYNYAMPFIRYDIGDYALASKTPCGCGRGLPSIDRIGGRARNRFVMPDGAPRRMRGSVLTDISKLIPYSSIQYVQTEMNTLELRYVPLQRAEAAEEEEITRILQQEFHAALKVRFVPVDRIERGPGFKIEQFVTMVNAGRQRQN